MNILIGLLIIAIGSFCVSSSYIPINKVKQWSWESYWLVQGIFAWILFPILGASVALAPVNAPLSEIFGAGGAIKSVIYGALWGVGGLTFGLSMRYLGVALGQSLSLGTCSAFGTLIPAILPQFFPGAKPLSALLVIGVAIAIAGIAIIGYAGALKSQNMSEEEKKKAVKDFALKKGLIIAIVAGVMSACFALGLESGSPITKLLLGKGVNPLFAGLPVVMLCTFGGFITNAAYCIQQNIVNKTGKDYIKVNKGIFVNNLLFCALAGFLWYFQWVGFEAGKSFMPENSVVLAFSWSILMSLNVLFSNVWGIILKEWKGAGKKTVVVLALGLAVLIASVIVVGAVS